MKGNHHKFRSLAIAVQIQVFQQLKSLQKEVVKHWGTTKLPRFRPSGAKMSETPTFKLFQGNVSDFAGKHSDLCDLLSELWRNWWVTGIRERSNTFTVMLRTYLIGWEKFLVAYSLHLRAKHCLEKKYRRISSRTIGRLGMTDKNFESIDKKIRGPSYTP